MDRKIIRLQGVTFYADTVIALQYHPAIKDSDGNLSLPASFDVLFTSGQTLNIVAGGAIFNKINTAIFGAEELAGA